MGENCPINKKWISHIIVRQDSPMVNPSDLIGFLLGPHLAKWTVSREMVMSPVS